MTTKTPTDGRDERRDGPDDQRRAHGRAREEPGFEDDVHDGQLSVSAGGRECRHALARFGDDQDSTVQLETST